MELKEFAALGEYIIVEEIDVKKMGAIEVVQNVPYFAVGKVLSSECFECSENDEIVYIRDNALEFGLGMPSNVFVIKLEDVVCVKKQLYEAE